MSLIKKMETLAKTIPWSISLSQWIPDFPMPQKLIDETMKSLEKWEANKYVDPAWIIQLREKLSSIYKSKYDAWVSTDEIIVVFLR